MGLPKSKPTRAAHRYFSERGLKFHDVDLRRHDLKPGELRKFVQKFGTKGCLDPESKAYQAEGLHYLSASDDEWMRRMADNPAILALPLVSCGKELAVGHDTDGWQHIVNTAKGG